MIPCTSRYYADIRQTISASDQEMNSALAELSRVRYLLLFSHLVKVTFFFYTMAEHINTFRTWKIPFSWENDKLDVEFEIKYE